MKKRNKKQRPTKKGGATPARRKKARTLPLLTGIFRSSNKGYGFVTLEGDEQAGQDIFIKSDHVHGALDRDRVTLKLKRHEGGRRQFERDDRPDNRREGEIVDILERGTDTFIGTLFKIREPRGRQKTYWCVIPDSPKYKLEPRVTPPPEAEEGDKVAVRILGYGDAKNPPTAEITKVFGNSLSQKANYAAILYEYGIEENFSEEVEKQAAASAAQPLSTEGRADFRDRIILTIDGADAKDLDDAVSIDALPDGGCVLGVHIADVFHYVRENTLLDTEALRRGTSVYFADKAIPMLPKALSNGACSLNAGEDKYALSALITLDAQGNIQNCVLTESVIHTAVRGIYSEVNDLLAHGENSRFFEKYRIVYPALLQMRTLYDRLAQKAAARGMLELDSADCKILLDGDGFPTEILKRERGVSERMIEQFMLCANEAVAAWLHTRGLPCVYRIHEHPAPEKIQSFSIFAHNLGLNITPLRKKTLTAADFAPILEEAAKKDLGTIVSRVLLRSLMKAKYSHIQSMHFGLALDDYCHFTSPIRRYPDLTVHCIVKAALRAKNPRDIAARYGAFAALSAKTSTENELRAVAAERAVEDLYKTLYMSRHVGEIFEATVSSVTSFGLFAELENTCEGFIPLSSLEGYFTFNEQNLTLSKGQTVYRLGDQLKVKIEGADIVRRRVEMSLVEP